MLPAPDIAVRAFLRTPAAAVVAMIAAVAVYLPSLRGGFIWDDPLVLQQLRAIGSLRDLFVLPAVIPKFYFRPLVFVTYLLDRALGGETPFWFHVSVLAFHVANVLLVWLLARRLFADNGLVAAGGALLFAVLPTHVESVAWMAGRSDVIVCTFVLITTLLSLDRQRTYTAWLGGLTFLLAALSKETAMACVVLIPLLDLLRMERLDWRRYVPLAIAVLVYFAFRHQALGTIGGGMVTAASRPALAGEALRAMGFYVIQTLFSARLCAYVSDVPVGAAYAAAGLIGLLAGAGLFVVGWKRHHWPLAFLTAWFFATLAPAFTVLVRRSASAPVADRYLYVPSVASCLLLVWALVHLAERRRLTARWVIAVLAAVSLTAGAHASRYTRVWADDLSFWSDVAAKVPDDALPHLELAGALQHRNRSDEAERALQQALAGKADLAVRAMTYNALGNLYRRLGRYEDAARALEAGIQMRPHPTLYHNLGMTLMMQLEDAQRRGDQATLARDIVRARDAFETAIRLGTSGVSAHGFPQWDAAKTHALLGQVLFSIGDRAAAREHLETSLRLEPSGPVADVTRRYLQSLPP